MKRYFREVALLSSPILLIGGIVLFVQIRRLRAPFINSGTPVHAAFFGAGNEIVSVGAPAPTPGARPSPNLIFARFDAKSGEKISEVSQNATVYTPTLSPDGRWLASIFRGGTNYFLSLRDVKNDFYRHAPLDTGSTWVPRMVWNHQASGIYLLNKNGAAFCDLNRMNLQPQKSWKRIFGSEFPVGAAFSPDGKLVAFSRAAQEVRDLAPGTPVPGARARKMIIGYYNDAIKVCSWPDLKPVAALPGDGLGPPRFTLDGRSLLATVCFKDGFSVVSAHIARLDLPTRKTHFVKIGAKANQLFGLERARFSPDGRVLVAMNSQQSHSFYSATTGRLIGQTRDLQLASRSIYWREDGDFSRDGRRFLSVWPDGIEIHDLSEMKP